MIAEQSSIGIPAQRNDVGVGGALSCPLRSLWWPPIVHVGSRRAAAFGPGARSIPELQVGGLHIKMCANFGRG